MSFISWLQKFARILRRKQTGVHETFLRLLRRAYLRHLKAPAFQSTHSRQSQTRVVRDQEECKLLGGINIQCRILPSP